ncbi:MarR family transcriptional regulator [Candidatus Nanohalovita haloferacivicina]|uniref:MarR family transcriptional regulator n=1 Tax=Candidatus Nanohalovita haloferacivicina TaxID=2978046 RepID=UPI00325FAF7D|nr:MarR family transcriptional regulator [Candidatus Nanohalobia archaeon BNXNv]
MRILTDNTGKGQLEILSALAHNSPQRQSELVENTSLSKGAVSNNVKKLRDKKLVEGEKELDINLEKIQQLYREHIETFLVRRSEEPNQLNELRTFVKKNISEQVTSQRVQDTIIEVLRVAKNREDLESLNSVFKETDRVLRETEGEAKMLGLITDRSNAFIDNSKIEEEAEKILDEVQN